MFEFLRRKKKPQPEHVQKENTGDCTTMPDVALHISKLAKDSHKVVRFTWRYTESYAYPNDSPETIEGRWCDEHMMRLTGCI